MVIQTVKEIDISYTVKEIYIFYIGYSTLASIIPLHVFQLKYIFTFKTNQSERIQ